MVMNDLYAHSAELDDATATMLADRLEIRGADPRQHVLWRDFLARPAYAPGSHVLEVGCGTGIITERIAALPGVSKADGVDPSPFFVERARRRAPHLHFEVADGRSLPFADASYDGVVLATALCHIPGPEVALAEAFRVLRPGGSLLVYDGDYATATVALAPHDPLQRCVDAAVAAMVYDPWIMRRLIPLVAAIGFEPGSMRSHGYLELDEPVYMPTLVTAGADRLAADGVISTATAAALKTEVADRAATDRFFGHIAYASLLATRP